MKKIITFLPIFLIISCSSTYKETDYPSYWWKPVDSKEKHSWEISPDSVKREDGEVILSKRNELGLMSNFAATPFTLDGERYESLEGFWQSMKYPEDFDYNDPRYNLLKELPYKRSEVAKLVGLKAYRAGKAANKILEENGIRWISYKGKRLFYKGRDQRAHFKIIRRATIAKIEQNEVVRKVLMETRGLKLLPDHKQSKDATKAYRYFEIYENLRDDYF